MKKWIGVDLDGTLAHYEGWRGHENIGEPIAPMVKRIKEWRAAGMDVRIFTARISEPDPLILAEVKDAIDAWTTKHIGERLPITNVKDFGMVELWDDRAIAVEQNTGRPLSEPQRRFGS